MNDLEPEEQKLVHEWTFGGFHEYVRSLRVGEAHHVHILRSTRTKRYVAVMGDNWGAGGTEREACQDLVNMIRATATIAERSLEML